MKWKFWQKSKAPEKRGFVEQVIASSALNYLGSGGTVAPNKALSLSAVYRCVEVISAACASMPLEVYKKVERGIYTPDYEHAVSDVITDNPDALTSMYEIIKAAVSSMLLWGNGYILIRRGANGVPKSLQLLKPQDVTIEVDDARTTLFYKWVHSDQYIDRTDMIHLKNYTVDGIVGISTLTHAANTLGLATSAEEHANKFYTSGASSSGIFKLKQEQSKKQFNKAGELESVNGMDNVRQSINEVYGAGGTGSGYILVNADMDYTPITVNPKDSQLLEVRHFAVDEICRFFGVSPTKAFDLRHSTMSNVESQQLAFITDTIYPLTVKIQQELSRKLFSTKERKLYTIRMDISALQKADLDSRSNYYLRLAQIGAVTVNEVRQDLGRSPIEGGDTALVQVNMSTLDRVIKGDAEKSAENVASDATEPDS